MKDQQRIEMTTDDHDTKDCTRLPVFIYAHELLDVGGGVWLGCPEEESVRKAHIPGETGDEVVELCRLTDAQALIAELREELRTSNECLDIANELCGKYKSRIAELRAENERLRSGMKGDYDLDAWLDWAKEAEALRAQLEQLQSAFPLFDEAGLSETEHHCEWSVLQERKRLHAILNPAPAAPIAGADCGHPACKDLGEPHPFCEFVAAQPVADEREAVTMQQVLIAYDYATENPGKYLRGTTNWCAAFAHSLNGQLKEPNHG